MQQRFYLAVTFLALLPSLVVAAEPKKVALLVGVNHYEKRGLAEHPLDYAEADAQGLFDELSKPTHGFQCTKLVGRRATKLAIETALAEILGSGLPADSIVLVGLAGHGQQIEVAGKEDAFFCPYDASSGDGTTMVSLAQMLVSLNRRGGINLLLVDACRDDPTRGGGNSRSSSISGNVLEGRLPANTAVLFSCAARQQAFETDKAGGGHGVFFYHVIEGVRGAAADIDGEITWDGLVTYVRPRVNARAKEWFPDRARLKVDGALQTPYQLTNLVAIPVIGRRTDLGAFAPAPFLSPANSVPPPASEIAFKPFSLLTNGLGMKLVLVPGGAMAQERRIPAGAALRR